MKRVAWVVFLGMVLNACGVYRVEDANIDRVDLELMPEALAVKVVAHGVLGNGCTRVGEVKQRREDRTFFVTIEAIYDQPARTGCTLAISEFQKEIVLDVAGLVGSSYAVNVNGVVKTFALPLSEQRTVKAHIETVDILLRESYPVQVIAEVTGWYGGCTTFIDISQRREEDTFFITVLVSAPILPGEPPCPPTEYPFTEQVTLETQNLTPGTYEVNVNGVVETFTLP